MNKYINEGFSFRDLILGILIGVIFTLLFIAIKYPHKSLELSEYGGIEDVQLPFQNIKITLSESKDYFIAESMLYDIKGEGSTTDEAFYVLKALIDQQKEMDKIFKIEPWSGNKK